MTQRVPMSNATNVAMKIPNVSKKKKIEQTSSYSDKVQKNQKLIQEKSIMVDWSVLL